MGDAPSGAFPRLRAPRNPKGLWTEAQDMRRFDALPAQFWRRLDAWLEQYWRQHPESETLITPLFGTQVLLKPALAQLLNDGIDLAPLFEEFMIPALPPLATSKTQSDLKPLKRPREPMRKKAVAVAEYLRKIRAVRPDAQIPFRQASGLLTSLYPCSPRLNVRDWQVPPRLSIDQALLVLDGIVRGLANGPGTWLIPVSMIGKLKKGGPQSKDAENSLQARLENAFEDGTGNRHSEQAGIIVSAIYGVARDSQESAQRQSSRLRKKGMHDQLRQANEGAAPARRRITVR